MKKVVSLFFLSEDKEACFNGTLVFNNKYELLVQ